MTQPTFVLAQFQVKDFPTYIQEYASKMGPLAAKFGGQFLAASRQADVKEGERFGNFTALIRFPSQEAAQAMYASEDYVPLKAKRLGELTDGGNLMFIPGIEAA